MSVLTKDDDTDQARLLPGHTALWLWSLREFRVLSQADLSFPPPVGILRILVRIPVLCLCD